MASDISDRMDILDRVGLRLRVAYMLYYHLIVLFLHLMCFIMFDCDNG